MNRYSHVIWDWNGTLLNDIEWCLSIVNRMLANRDLKPLGSVSEYRNVFCFPIIEYYKNVGFDFEKEPFETLAEEYAEKLLNIFLRKTHVHTFCDGISGIFYLFNFLREHDFIDMDVSESESMVDNYLITQMRKDMQQRYYDFMHGALGVGLYFLKKRSNPECIQELMRIKC